jgi:hypothetical protein
MLALSLTARQAGLSKGWMFNVECTPKNGTSTLRRSLEPLPARQGRRERRVVTTLAGASTRQGWGFRDFSEWTQCSKLTPASADPDSYLDCGIGPTKAATSAEGGGVGSGRELVPYRQSAINSEGFNWELPAGDCQLFIHFSYICPSFF